jgi:Zn-dependent protease
MVKGPPFAERKYIRMRVSWKLGRVAGIDVYLHPTFFLVMLFVLVSAGGAFAATVMLAAYGCVVLHELGHALMARRYGIATEDITIYPIGGVARLSRMPKSPGAELLIALAGPAVNVLIAIGLVGLALLMPLEVSGQVGPFLMNLLLVNVVLAVFNLIPAFPMDGGRVLRALLSGWLGRLNATRIAAGLGRFLAVAGGVYCIVTDLSGLWLQVLLAVFIYFAAGAELAQVEAEENRNRYDRFDGDDGIWTAPRGYHWVQRGSGVWQLAPVVIDTGDKRGWR